MNQFFLLILYAIMTYAIFNFNKLPEIIAIPRVMVMVGYISFYLLGRLAGRNV